MAILIALVVVSTRSGPVDPLSPEALCSYTGDQLPADIYNVTLSSLHLRFDESHITDTLGAADVPVAASAAFTVTRPTRCLVLELSAIATATLSSVEILYPDASAAQCACGTSAACPAKCTDALTSVVNTGTALRIMRLDHPLPAAALTTLRFYYAMPLGGGKSGLLQQSEPFARAGEGVSADPRATNVLVMGQLQGGGYRLMPGLDPVRGRGVPYQLQISAPTGVTVLTNTPGALALALATRVFQHCDFVYL